MIHSKSSPLNVTKININEQQPDLSLIFTRRRSSVQRNLEKLQKRFQHLNSPPSKNTTNNVDIPLKFRRRQSTAIMEKTTYKAKDSFTLKNNNNFSHNTTDYPLNVSNDFLRDLRNDFVLPEEQKNDNISNNELYSDQNLLKRESLKFDKGIRGVLTKLWLLVDSNNDNTIEKHEYYELHRRLLRALVGVVSVEEERVMCDEDWIQDIGISNIDCDENKSTIKNIMTKKQFTNAFFRMVDLWTEKICVDEYYTFLSDAFNRISMPDGIGGYMFKNIDDVKRRSRRASMIVINGKVCLSEPKGNVPKKKKKKKKLKKHDNEGWWCRLYGTGPWWNRLKGVKKSTKSKKNPHHHQQQHILHHYYHEKNIVPPLVNSSKLVTTAISYKRNPAPTYYNMELNKPMKQQERKTKMTFSNRMNNGDNNNAEIISNSLGNNKINNINKEAYHHHINHINDISKCNNIENADFNYSSNYLLTDDCTDKNCSNKSAAAMLPMESNGIDINPSKYPLPANDIDNDPNWYNHMEKIYKVSGQFRGYHKDFFLATNLRSKLNCGGGYLNRYHSHDSLHPNNDHMVVNNESRNNNFDKFLNTIYDERENNRKLSIATLVKNAKKTTTLEVSSSGGPESDMVSASNITANQNSVKMKLSTNGNIALSDLQAIYDYNNYKKLQDIFLPPPLSNSDNNNINNRIKLKKLIKKRHRKRSKKVRKRRKRRRGKSFLQIQGKQRLQQRFLVSSSR